MNKYADYELKKYESLNTVILKQFGTRKEYEESLQNDIYQYKKEEQERIESQKNYWDWDYD